MPSSSYFGFVLLVSALLAGCNGDSPAATKSASPISAMAALGEQIFNDVNLSASGQMSCATCHSADHFSGPGNDLAAQFGGPGPVLNLQGGRQSPAIRYLNYNTAFFFDSEGTPTGGFFWDGRANSLQEQAAGPFLNPVEMAMPSQEAVVEKLQQATYKDDFKAVFGADIFDQSPSIIYERMTLAIQQYEKEDATLHAFSSKYDAFLDGKATLSEQEMRGYALFNNPQKGNCQGCHPSAMQPDGSHPVFTDFTYDTLGVPRNPELAQNNDPAYFDLGLCARDKGDLLTRTDLCGAFKVPSLRNVWRHGEPRAFFHNGYFKDLKTAVQFYVQRDTNPEKWYPTDPTTGEVQKFNDLPPEYHKNVNITEVPYNRHLGDAPALSDEEIDDVVAFLKTLDDGYFQP